VRANTRTDPGNFHMKPNGVLYVAGHLPGSSKLVCFLSRSPRADSHPVGADAGQHFGLRHRRNRGFVRRVRAFFRDKLQCKNALFLDGGIAPSLYSPESGRKGNLLPLGPMIGIYDRAN
jgi:uncharacterized protein YigE (DUF2233 family)